MLDLNLIRAQFAEYLASNASKRHSLDAALMHVVEQAYQKGMEDERVKININEWEIKRD